MHIYLKRFFRNHQLAVSNSNGTLALCVLNSGADLTCVRTWSAHQAEAWITAFDRWNSDTLYSGYN